MSSISSSNFFLLLFFSFFLESLVDELNLLFELFDALFRIWRQYIDRPLILPPRTLDELDTPLLEQPVHIGRARHDLEDKNTRRQQKEKRVFKNTNRKERMRSVTNHNDDNNNKGQGELEWGGGAISPQ